VTYPAVPAKESRLRFFLTAAHTDDELAAAVDATAEELGQVRAKMHALNVVR
jgi:8-amino-7-oxononanoate synthase